MGRRAPCHHRTSHARLGADLRAVTAIEYALITAIMAMVIVTGVSLFGGNLGVTYGHVSDSLIGAEAAASGQTGTPASTGPNGTTSPQTPSGGANGPTGQTVQSKTANPAASSN